MEIDSENLFIPEAFWQNIMNVMDAVLACLLVFYGLSNGREVVIRKNTRLYGRDNISTDIVSYYYNDIL